MVIETGFQCIPTFELIEGGALFQTGHGLEGGCIFDGGHFLGPGHLFEKTGCVLFLSSSFSAFAK